MILIGVDTSLDLPWSLFDSGIFGA